MNRGNPLSSSLGVSSPPNVFGAVLDALVVILLRHLKRPLRQHGAFRDPFLSPAGPRGLKTDPYSRRRATGYHHPSKVGGRRRRGACSPGGRAKFRSEAVVGSRTSSLAISENMGFSRIASEVCEPELEFIHEDMAPAGKSRGRIRPFLDLRRAESL